MQVIKTEIEGVLIIEPDVYVDERGYFLETFRMDRFRELTGLNINFVQDNESLSHRFVLRGLHYQTYPKPQAKLVRVVRGVILDVAVDLRKGSPTFKRWVMVELSGENKRQFFIPRGFAHGFLSLEDNTVVAYKVDEYFSPECDRGIRFNDPDIGIDWRYDSNEFIISPKDCSLPYLRDAEVFDG